jgi:hypothetical protein
MLLNTFFHRTALQLAEVDREGGISPHISPMTGNSSMHFRIPTVLSALICFLYRHQRYLEPSFSCGFYSTHGRYR